tara:strand:+ start:41 stop:1234 length:1194 start_codon:yes stop_codon:yes gene_type:complete
MEKEEERLIGSRAKELFEKGVSKIPNNGVTRGLAFTAKVLEANLYRNPLTRAISQGEDFLASKGGQLAKHLGAEPFIGELGVSLMIPGGGGEAKATKKLLKTSKYLDTASNVSPLYRRMASNKKFIQTHGGSWEDAVKFMESGYEYWGKKVVKNGNGNGNGNGIVGTLKGMEGGRYWTNPTTGQTFRLKPSVTAKDVDVTDMKGISLKDEAAQQASKFKRDRGTKVDVNKVNEIVKEMGGTPDQAAAYIKMNKLEKKALTTYIAKLNKKAGSTEFSLGHKVAAEKFDDSADIASNLKLERFRTTEKGGLGNAARSNKAEITDDLNTALNASFSLKEDIAKFLDPTVGAFWVGMNNAQKKQMMELVQKGMNMDDALDKVGFGKTILGESVANVLPPRH